MPFSRHSQLVESKTVTGIVPTAFKYIINQRRFFVFLFFSSDVFSWKESSSKFLFVMIVWLFVYIIRNYVAKEHFHVREVFKEGK